MEELNFDGSYNLVDHSIENLISAVRTGRTSSETVLNKLRDALAEQQRAVELELDRVRAFADDLYLEPPSDKSEYFWDKDRNRDPFRYDPTESLGLYYKDPKKNKKWDKS
jgi:hypothetical protein